MQFLLVIRTDTARWAELDSEARNRIHEECGAWHQELASRGGVIAGAALQPIGTVFREDAAGGVRGTDGPFPETKEVIGGLEIVEFSSYEEAQAHARSFPALKVGSSIEVRPLMEGPCRD